MKRLLLWLICVAALLGGAVGAQVTRSIVPREAGEAGIGTAGKPWGAGYFWALYLGEDSVEFPFVEVIAYGPRIDALEARVDDWNAAHGWGNHAGLYRLVTWVPDWTDILNRPATATRWPAWGEVTGKPTEFPAEAHVHTIANVTGLQTELDGKETADATILKQADVVNNLTSTSITAPLSAAQGKALEDGKEAADATILKQADVVNNLTSTSITAPLSAAQGKALEDTKLNLTEGSYVIAVPGDNLATKYTAAKALTPNSAELAADNRATLYVFEGAYNFTEFTAGTDFVDIIVIGAEQGKRARLVGGAIVLGADAIFSGIDWTDSTNAPMNNGAIPFVITANATASGEVHNSEGGDYVIGDWNNNTNNFAIVGTEIGNNFCRGGTNEGAITNSEIGNLFCANGTNNGAITNSEIGSNFCTDGTNEGAITNSKIGSSFCGHVMSGGTNNGTIRSSTFDSAASAIKGLSGDGEYISCVDSAGVLFSTADAEFGDVTADTFTGDGSALTGIDAMVYPSITELTLSANASWQPATGGDLLRVMVEGDHELEIEDPADATVPKQVSIQLIQDATTAYQVVLAGNLETSGGVSLADIQSTALGAVDTLTFQWDGAAYIFRVGTYDHK